MPTRARTRHWKASPGLKPASAKAGSSWLTWRFGRQTPTTTPVPSGAPAGVRSMSYVVAPGTGVQLSVAKPSACSTVKPVTCPGACAAADPADAAAINPVASTAAKDALPAKRMRFPSPLVAP